MRLLFLAKRVALAAKPVKAAASVRARRIDQFTRDAAFVAAMPERGGMMEPIGPRWSNFGCTQSRGASHAGFHAGQQRHEKVAIAARVINGAVAVVMQTQ